MSDASTTPLKIIDLPTHFRSFSYPHHKKAALPNKELDIRGICACWTWTRMSGCLQHRRGLWLPSLHHLRLGSQEPRQEDALRHEFEARNEREQGRWQRRRIKILACRLRSLSPFTRSRSASAIFVYLVCCDFKSLIWQSSDDFRIPDSAPLSASPCLSPFFVHSCSFLQCHFFSRLPPSDSRTLIVTMVELCLCRGWKWKRSI